MAIENLQLFTNREVMDFVYSKDVIEEFKFMVFKLKNIIICVLIFLNFINYVIFMILNKLIIIWIWVDNKMMKIFK